MANSKPTSDAQDVPQEQVQYYEEIENGPEFKALEKSKARFIIPATIFFMVYYFLLPILVGFWTDSTGKSVMDARIFPGFSWAYLFALSQFIMAWILAFIYLLAFAPKMDKLVSSIVAKVTNRNTQRAKGGR